MEFFKHLLAIYELYSRQGEPVSYHLDDDEVMNSLTFVGSHSVEQMLIGRAALVD